MQPQAARDFYALQQRLTEVSQNEVARLWRRMGDDFDSSWRRVGPSILAVITTGQEEAAKGAEPYMRDLLDDLRIPDEPVGEFRPDSLVGVASDGRRLDTLAAQSVALSKAAITDGATTQGGLDAGGNWLNLMTTLQVADAARVAVGIGAASRRNIGGHVRVLTLPVCQRCAILGGRFYRWSSGFDRHPRDDCTMMPVPSEQYALGNSLMTNPREAYLAGEIKDLTPAQIAALESGADLNDVVNASRGMSTTALSRAPSARQVHMREKANAAYAKGLTSSTSAGAPDLLNFLPPSVRNRAPSAARLTPEGIYQLAGDNRSEVIRLLRREGYIT